MLTEKQRIYAALEGRVVDRMPVTSLYNQLYILDHYAELTGQAEWQMHEWQNAEPDQHIETYRQIIAAVPFEILQPQLTDPRQVRENRRFIFKDGQALRHDLVTDALEPLSHISGHATDYRANETQFVFSRQDVQEQFKLRTDQQQIDEGIHDYARAAVAAFGQDHFILTGGVVGTLYLCHNYLGLTSLFEMLASDPDLVDYLSARILEQNIEDIRAHASAGGDAIYIDDATSTSDMISVRHYERFCMPYMKQMVDEIHRLGHKAILIYFGGVADRLEQIAALGADGLSVEASMKGYTNDMAHIARTIGKQVTLFGNIDPIAVLQDGSDVVLAAEIEKQAKAGRTARGFIISTGSPITPGTPLARVQNFIELSRQS